MKGVWVMTTYNEIAVYEDYDLAKQAAKTNGYCFHFTDGKYELWSSHGFAGEIKFYILKG